MLVCFCLLHCAAVFVVSSDYLLYAAQIRDHNQLLFRIHLISNQHVFKYMQYLYLMLSVQNDYMSLSHVISHNPVIISKLYLLVRTICMKLFSSDQLSM